MTDAVRGAVLGAVAALCVVYSFQTKVVYPDWVLATWDHPWIFVVLVIVSLYIFVWSQELAVLLLLVLAAIIADKILFGRVLYPVVNVEKTKQESVEPSEIPTVDLYGPPSASSEIVSEPQYPLFYGLESPQIGPAPF